ncbi:hypothetical protein KA005_38180 [bacterium]|nr:hypothetical protein [bacterium]
MIIKTQEEVEERYIFLRLFEHDLYLAKSSILMIKRYKKRDVKHALYRDAVISYARPFSKNYGRIKNHRLDKSIVPTKHKVLHDDLLEFRNQWFTHTDIKAHDPTLVRWPTKSGYTYPIAFKNLFAKPFENKLPEMSALIQEVRDAIIEEEQMIESQWSDSV